MWRGIFVLVSLLSVVTLGNSEAQTPTFTPVPEGCDLLVDGGFEEGRDNPGWDETISGDTHILQQDVIGARSGQWVAVFGGVEGIGGSQVLSQTVTITSGDVQLGFYVRNLDPGSGDQDWFQASIDDTQLVRLTPAEATAYTEYMWEGFNVSAWADGAQHVIRFECEYSGDDFFKWVLDDVALDTCAVFEDTPTPTETGDPGITPTATPSPTVTGEPNRPGSLLEVVHGWYRGYGPEDLIWVLENLY